MKISEAHSLLISIVNDWHGLLLNYRGIRQNSRITWDGYKSWFLDHPVLPSTVAELVDAGQYTFQVAEDGSIIQIYYAYDVSGNHLQAARLAFYRAYADNPMITKFSIPGEEDISIDVTSINIRSTFDEESLRANTEENIVDKDFGDSHMDSDMPVSWLRIEYAPLDARGVLHHNCHMHLSAFPHSRIAVAGVPNPRQFVELVMALGYPECYKTHRLDGQGRYSDETKIRSVNTICIPWEESQLFNQITHFRIPFNPRHRQR